MRRLHITAVVAAIFSFVVLFVVQHYITQMNTTKNITVDKSIPIVWDYMCHEQTE